jgi:hypothetical protein
MSAIDLRALLEARTETMLNYWITLQETAMKEVHARSYRSGARGSQVQLRLANAS